MTRRIALISTGGTIEKTYDELRGVLENQVSVLDVMLGSLDLRGVTVHRFALMNKDSLDMSPEDHALIAQTAIELAGRHDGVVVVHGTDRLAVPAPRVVALPGPPPPPIVSPGARGRWGLRPPAPLQNLTEALLAVQ